MLPPPQVSVCVCERPRQVLLEMIAAALSHKAKHTQADLLFVHSVHNVLVLSVAVAAFSGATPCFLLTKWLACCLGALMLKPQPVLLC